GAEWHRNGLSIDGTTVYLDRLAKEYPERITIHRPPDRCFWQGKLAMVNAVLPDLPHECLLWQIDADELWTAAQIGRMHAMFTDHPERTAAFFHCHFFVAPNLVTITPETYSHYNAYEWLRVWRFQRGMCWHSHEPPKLMQPAGGGWRDLAECRPFRHHETEGAGLVFTHYAYAIESQVRFKESYYGYAGAVAQWRRLQQVKELPVRLGDYLNWVKDAACVDQPERAVIGRNVPPVAWPLRAQKEARRPHIVIDGVIFQLQHRRPLGIARVWSNLLPSLVRAIPNARFTLLVRRGYVPRADLEVPQHVIDAYQWGDEAALDRDDTLLAETCRILGADLFISTYFTRAPGYTNLVLVHDLIPELTGADLTQPEWRSKQRAIETGDLFAAVSECTRNDLHRIYPHTHRHLQAITGNGTSATFVPQPEYRIDQFKKKYALSRPYLLMVGNRRGYKNGATLFEIMSQGEWDNGPQVVCVGGETRLTPLEKRLADRQLVRFLPYLEDEELATAYGGAFALICLSAYEGFGLPLVESMACGCPVISTGGG
ncbi:MAG: glycosyltransferase, partial [Desulfatitalea sp.]